MTFHQLPVDRSAGSSAQLPRQPREEIPMATRERTGTRTVNRSRRSVIKAGLAGLVAAGAGARADRGGVGTGRAVPRRIRRHRAGRPAQRPAVLRRRDHQRRGARDGEHRHQGVPRHSVRRRHVRRQPLHAAAEAGRLDGRRARRSATDRSRRRRRRAIDPTTRSSSPGIATSASAA